MGNLTKLLNKPLRTFIVFTCLVLACSIPVYFYLVESIWLDELDDHNQQVKNQILTRFSKSDPEELKRKITLWNEIQVSSHIRPVYTFHEDSIYLTEREIMDGGSMELERFRGLSSVISLNGNFYEVIVETNVEEVHETVFDISLVTTLFVVLLIIGFILLNRYLSKQIWKPFTDTLQKLKQFDLNSASVIHFSETDIREFAQLNTVLTKLIDNNIRIYKQQKEFAQNASHELQTPLALLKTKIDLLIQDPTLSPEQRNIIDALDNSVSRVTRINKNLLLLAGIENKTYESKEIDLALVVKTLTEVFKDFAEDKACHISVNIDERFEIKANESLAEILISNLISNAVRHCSAGSSIAVSLNNRVLSVSNDGEFGLNEAKLFQRFISTNSKNPGTGLGLAIVKEICDKYNWQVRYVFENNRHIFSILF